MSPARERVAKATKGVAPTSQKETLPEDIFIQRFPPVAGGSAVTKEPREGCIARGKSLLRQRSGVAASSRITRRIVDTAAGVGIEHDGIGDGALFGRHLVAAPRQFCAHARIDR